MQLITSRSLFRPQELRLLYNLINSNQKCQLTSEARFQFIQNQQLDFEYVCNDRNWDEIERNIRLRRKTEFLEDWTRARNSFSIDRFRDWIKDNAIRMPNRLHSKWIEMDDQIMQQEKESFEVNSFGQLPKFKQPNCRKAEQLFRLKNWLQLPQHEQIGFVGGARSYVMLDELCALRDAVVAFAMDHLVDQHGFTRVVVPNLLYEPTVASCGFATRSKRSQVYTIDGMSNRQWRQNLLQQEQQKSAYRKSDNNEDLVRPSFVSNESAGGVDVCMAGTAEISLAALHFGEQLDHEQLPRKYCAVSRCYRAEVSPRSEEGGLYRVHYFDKVEMFAFSDPNDSDRLLQQFVNIQQDLFAALGLSGRVLDMPPHELGNSASRKFDVEVFLPGRALYGELSSASNCADYQSRRLNVYSRRLAPNFSTNEPFDIRHVHTINGTAVAVPRMLIALAETHQTPDGDIAVPQVLQPYLPGQPTLLSRRNNCFVGRKKHYEQLMGIKLTNH